MENTSSFIILKRILKYMKSYRYFIGMCVMTAMFASMSIIQSIAIKYLFDAAERQDQHQLALTSLGLVIASIILIGSIPFFRFMYNGRAVIGKGNMKLDAFKCIILLPVTYYENVHSGIIMTNITSDIDIASSIFTWRLHLAIAPFIYGAFSLIPMIILDWRITLVLVAINILLASVNLLFTKPIRETSQRIQENLDKFNEKLFNMLSGFEVMKLFPIKNIISGYYTEECNRSAKEGLKRVRLSACVASLNESIGRATNIGMILAGAWLVDKNLAAIGTILTLINLQGNVTGAFLQAGNRIPQLQEGFVSGKRLFSIMDTDPEPERYPTDYETSVGAALEMKNVSFSYDNEDIIVQNINLMVKRGQTAALVGPSGGGKSTILKLLLGFYPAEKGNIIINEKSMGQYTLTQIRDQIAYVPQDTYLFYGTIEENIGYGKVNATHEEIVEAAKAAYAHDFIMKQPQGYQTVIGENGTSLSGGQKQRITIARAFLKNAPILLLDEATSSLDSESEKVIQQAMKTLMVNRTILVIAHRLSTVEHADIIYVMNEGQIVEQGNHMELYKKNGLYKELYNTQYKDDNVYGKQT